MADSLLGIARPADRGLRHLRPAVRRRHRGRPRSSACRNVHSSTATLTALIERIGYEAAEHLAEHLAAGGDDAQQNLRRLVVDHGLLTAEEFDELTSPDRVMRLGSPGQLKPPAAHDRVGGAAQAAASSGHGLWAR